MSILSGYKKEKLTRADSDGNHKLISRWTNASTVEFDDGKTLADKMVGINNETPTYTVASSNTALSSGEKLSVAFGKIAKAVSSLISHLSDSVSHITSGERTTWNGKLNSSAVTTSLASTSTTNALAASAGKNLQDQITSLNSDKANDLKYGTFTGNIDKINHDGSDGCLRENSIVWIIPGASGNLPGEYFVLETFVAMTDVVVQTATIYIYQSKPIIKQRLFCNNVWSDWGGYMTDDDLRNLHRIIGQTNFTINETMAANINNISYSLHDANGEIQMSSAYINNSGTVIATIPESIKPLYNKSFLWAGYYNNDWFSSIGYYDANTRLITLFSPYQDGIVYNIRVILDWVY
jgi:hypothetical protein